MAETIVIICPECEKSIKAPEDAVGKKIRCKGCGEAFTVKPPRPAKGAKSSKGAKPGKAPAKPAAKVNADGEEEGSYGVTSEYLGVRCPNCLEPMEDDDKICLNCGYNIVTRQKPRQVKIQETSGTDVFLWLLPGILCVLGIIVVVALDILYCVKVFPETFGDGDFGVLYFLGWKAFKVWATILTLFICYYLGRFAVKRLILNNKPPEVELKWGEE
jgi:DNA-directed RNA polymerase subunit RPC12/RpoP